VDVYKAGVMKRCMWQLFPKSWFPSQGRSASAIAVAADQFAAKWREYLVTALSEVLSRGDLTFDSAIVSLPSLKTEQLLAFDRAMRHRWRFHSDIPIQGRPPSVTPLDDPIEGTAHLFTAACHGNGFIRERALLAFEYYLGRLALVAALIRCDDWVPAVQQAAVSLLIRLVESEFAALMFDELALLLRLKQRQRVSEQVWPAHIEPALRSPRFREARWRSTHSLAPEVRAFAYGLVLEAEPDRSEEVFRRASADLHPRVAIWALGNLNAHMTGAFSQELLRRAIQHKSAAVRAYALRRHAATKPGDLLGELESGIFDSSRGPRDAAAYLLDHLFQVSARESWREAIDSGDGGRLYIALMALSYEAEAEDTDRMVPFLGNSSARIRAIALRGLVRAKSARADESLLQSLSDPSGLVVRCALDLLSRDGQLLEKTELEKSYSKASNERVRRQLIRGARLLAKWDALEFLLHLVSSLDVVTAEEEIDRWFRGANRRFTALEAGTRARLKDFLEEIPLHLRNSRWQRVEEVVRQS
jgi:hypothetical protein